MKTYTMTYPLYYPEISLGSIVHPDHLGSHLMGKNVIKNIMDNSGETPLPFLKKICD